LLFVCLCTITTYVLLKYLRSIKSVLLCVKK